MENLSSSIESLKSIYLNEIHMDISLELDQELARAEKSQGFEKLTCWKNFADKWAYVVAQKTPELFEVFTGIINDALEIVEGGKKHLQLLKDQDKINFHKKTDELKKSIKKLELELESKDKENCTKRKCLEDKHNLAQEITGLNLNIEKLEKMITSKQESKELLGEIQELQGKIRNFEESLARKDQDIEEYKGKDKFFEEKTKAYKVKINNYKEKMKEFELDRKEFEDNLKEKEEHLKECFRKIKEQQDFIKKIESEKEEIKQNCIQEKNNEKDEEIQRLQKKITDMQLKFNSFQENLVEIELETNTTLEKNLGSSQKYLSSQVNSSKFLNRKEIIPKHSSISSIKAKPMARELTLKELKETIEEIYENKAKFDLICIENKKPKETMDHYIMIYFNQKYGIKTLIYEYTKLFNIARSRYERLDSEVSLFSKILNNRVDEYFHQDFDKIKEKLKLKLKVLILQFNPYMREAQLTQVLKEKVNGNLSSFEWESILNLFYSKEESDLMIQNIRKIIEQKEEKLVIGKRNKLITEKSEITYQEVQNAILAYDLVNYEALTEPFWRTFCEEDQDKDGVLTDEQFKVLCIKLGVEIETERYLDELDPVETGFVTFSDCIRLFSFEMVDEDGGVGPVSIIHYLFFKESKGLVNN